MSGGRNPLHPQVGPAILNPGTGPVLNAELGHAEANIKALIADAAVDGAEAVHVPGWDSEGRFHFDVSLNGRTCEVEMPGWALDRVRYLGKPQNIWDFPRLYVAGSSWVWCYAVNQLREALTSEEEPDL